jgi:signal transduction histidine kinase
MGLSGISSRVDFLHGKLNILSSPGHGCSYEIDIPISS